MTEEDAIKLGVQALKAGEKGVKIQEVEIAIINDKGFKKYYGDDSIKFVKKFW
jgi:20S proteasome alpha/beta subunit